MRWLRRWLRGLLFETCPNCESAYTGGHPDPDNRGPCVVCYSPWSGENTCRVWKWIWLHRILIVRRNFKLLRSEEGYRRCLSMKKKRKCVSYTILPGPTEEAVVVQEENRQ